MSIDPATRFASVRNLGRPASALARPAAEVTVADVIRAVDGPLPVPGGEQFELGYFLLAVEDVRQDAAAEWEGGMRITGAITYAPAPSLDAWWESVRATSSTMRPLLDRLSPAEHYTLRDAVEARWAPYVAKDGSVAIPGRALGVATEA